MLIYICMTHTGPNNFKNWKGTIMGSNTEKEYEKHQFDYYKCDKNYLYIYSVRCAFFNC